MFRFVRILSFVFTALAVFAVVSLGADEAPKTLSPAALPRLDSIAETVGSDTPERVRSFAAENALKAGLPALAIEISRRLLEDKNLSNAQRRQLLFTLSGAQLATGDYARAAETLSEIGGDFPQKRLRAAFVALGNRRAGDAEKALRDLNVDALPKEERLWFFLAQALTASFLGDAAAVEKSFSIAKSAAQTFSERDHVDFVRQWAAIMAGSAVSKEELERLKASRDAAVGTPALGATAKLYIVALAKSGDRAGALAALQATRPIPAKEAADFALMEGLLADDPSGESARAAFERVIAERPPRSRQSAAFAGLLRCVRTPWNAGKKEEAILAANGIEKFLSELPADERVRDLELFTRARIALEIENFRLAEKWAEELNSQFPASPFVPDSLRLLVGIAVEEKEYRRAVPLLERLRATEMSLDETLRTDILIADCNFLSGDYALAADAYARASETNALSGDELGVIFFQQAFSAVRSGNVVAATTLLDSLLAKRVPAGWTMRSECVVIEALQQAGLLNEAAARAKKFLARTDLLPDFRVRILWIQALLALDLGDPKTASRNADLIADLASNLGANASNALRETAPELVSRVVLLKARALFLSGDDEGGFKLLADLRERYPDSISAVVSWLEEGRRFNELGKPARALISYETLIERYGSQAKLSEYAAIAAFEASQSAATIGRPEEAVKQMQVLISRYPKSPLAFYARMRQADFFRILNDFDSALAVYDNLIASERNHSAMRTVEMRRADTLSAIAARAESDKNALGTFLDARGKAESAYERLFSLPDQSLSLKAEAGFKWGYAVEHSVPANGDATARNRARKEAQTIYWKVVMETFDAARERGGKTLEEVGGYWVARSLFALASAYEKDGDYESARGVYKKILEWNERGLIPGEGYAEWLLKKNLEK